MTQANSHSKSWKDFLLRSSLPLESIVEDILGDCGLLVFGEFPYMRHKEDASEAEFSVDAWARTSLRASSLLAANILVECKYVSPGATWVFLPLSMPEEQGVNLRSQLLTIVEETSQLHLGPEARDKLMAFGSGLRVASKGVTIREKQVDPNSIRHGIYQMRFALPNLVAMDVRLAQGLFTPWQFRATVICGIVVTTAPIRVLKKGIELEAYRRAQKLEDVTEAVDKLVVVQFPGPEILSYCRRLCAALKTEGPAWEQAVVSRAKLCSEKGEGSDRERKELDQLLEYRFVESAQHVAVVHVDALSTFISDIVKVVESANEHVAVLQPAAI